MADKRNTTVTRRQAMTATTAGAVAAAVPAIASAKAAEDPLATDRARDQAIQDLAERMPADARAWIDTARAAGSRVHVADDASGQRYLGHGFANTDPEVTGFLQRWQTTRLDAGDLIAELKREQPGENDLRLDALVDQQSAVLRERDRMDGLPEADLKTEADREWQLSAIIDSKNAILEEAAKLEPDTTAGAAALVKLIERDRIIDQPFHEQAQNEPIAAMIAKLFAFTKRQAGEA